MAFPASFQKGKTIEDLVVISPDVFREKRGAIWTSYEQAEYEAALSLTFNHDKFSISKKNVLRGIHGDAKTWKLISCPFGDITVVLADMREESPSYLKHEMFRLNEENKIQILVPPMIGNSFYVHSETAVYFYKLSYQGAYADFGDQFTVAWNDSRLGIEWPCQAPILSDRDGRL